MSHNISFLESDVSSSSSDEDFVATKKMEENKTKRSLNFTNSIASSSQHESSSSSLNAENQASFSSVVCSTPAGKSIESDLVELKKMVATVLDQNKKLMERMDKLEEKQMEPSSKKKTIDVPNDVRYHVKLSYKEGYKQNIPKWKIDNGLSAFHEENLKTTNYIRNFVVGLHPNLPDRDQVINAAIKTYYESQRTQQRKKKNHPESMKMVARNQRRVHKAERRAKALQKVEGLSEENKRNMTKALIPEMMSSEEEKENDDGERYFEVKKPSWRTKKYQKLLDKVDSAYTKTCSKRSKEQLVKRTVGTPCKRKAPKALPYGYDMFVSDA